MVKELQINGFVLDGFNGFKNFAWNQMAGVNLMTGRNGVGKSLLLKIVWFMNHIEQAHIVNCKYSPLNSEDETGRYLSEVIEYMFDTKDITGSFAIETELTKIYCEFKDTKIVAINLDVLDPSKYSMDNLTQNIYISTEAKDLKNYERFLKIIRKLNIKKIQGIKEIRQLKDYFTLDIITWYSTLKYRLDEYQQVQSNPLVLDFCKGLKELPLGSSLYVKNSIPYINEDGNIKKLSAYSSGDVSILSLVLFYTGGELAQAGKNYIF